MEAALRPLALDRHPNLLVGIETCDDAGVYQISDQVALVQTVDFITPIVDDPYLFGQIAACNALNDVYAMGGKPLTAMNIVGFPRLALDISILTQILEGGLEKIHEAGAVLVGGHTVDDVELKYGLSVTGTVHPAKIVTNRGAQVGDVLILTKPLGTGVLSTANKAGEVEMQFWERAIDYMTRLNNRAAEAMVEVGAHACTDITGFGLLGHALEMARAGDRSFRFYDSRIPIFPGVKKYAAQGIVPGGAYCNQDHFSQDVEISARIPEPERILLYDPQTSGGLLIAVSQADGPTLMARLRAQGMEEAVIIGEVTPQEKRFITVEY